MSHAGPTEVEIRIELDPRLNAAMHQNGFRMVHRIELVPRGEHPIEAPTLELVLEPGGLAPTVRRIARLDPGKSYVLDDLDLTVDPQRLVGLIEAERALLRIAVKDRDGKPIGTHDAPVELLAYNQWGGTRSPPELLAAFVLPNHPGLPALLKESSACLAGRTGTASLDAYQSKDPGRARSQAEALFDAIGARGLTYVSPPASFEASGQKVRTPEVVLGEGLATCLDLAVLYAAGLEAMGLHALIFLVADHAFVGAWLIDETFPEPAHFDDPARTRKRIDLGELVAIEATLLTQASRPGFDDAVRAARKRLEAPGEFFCTIDIASSRAAGIRPLPPRVGETAFAPVLEPTPRGPRPLPAPVPPAPLGPAAGPASRPARVEKSRWPRLERWKEKLLDLTKHNPLLNFRGTGGAVPLFVPCLADLEDSLYRGTAFDLLPKPASLAPSAPRVGDPGPASSEVSASAALDPELLVQLEADFRAHRLRANLTEADLAYRLTKLFRGARLSLEEGGANLLFLAVGMLHWFDSASSQLARRAPILLLPVELSRTSRKFKLSLLDEEPRLNLTLVKMLDTEFGIRVQGVDPLPEDDSGVDVGAVLSAFRKAVLDQKRFDIRDECTLGIFSFTKFLMWRDLEQHADSLLESPVVRHLVESPEAPYPGQGAMPEAHDLDRRAPAPDSIHPVDADSSQQVAIEAAIAGKTFVLEGPPGTGKSQTITNIVAAALRRNRRVLFVSEKMAALEVVRSRLEKIGLGPFCLELHSTKLRKETFYRQLARAWEASGCAPPADFAAKVKKLGESRDALNAWVDTMHRPRPIGFSAFQATAKSIGLHRSPWIPLEVPLDADTEAAAIAPLRDACDRLIHASESVGDPAKHPWASVRRTRWEPALARQVGASLDRLGRAAGVAERATLVLAGKLGLVHSGWTREVVAVLARLLPTLGSDVAWAGAWAGRPDWPRVRPQLLELIELGRVASRLEAGLAVDFDVPRLLAMDLPMLARRFKDWGGSFFPVRWLMLRGAWAQLGSAARDVVPVQARVVEALAAALELASTRDRIGKYEAVGRDLLGVTWKGPETDWELVDRARSFADGLLDAALTLARVFEVPLPAVLDPLGRTVPNDPGLLTGGAQALAELDAALGELEALLDLDPALAFVPRRGETEPIFALAARRIGEWRPRIGDLRDWCAWREARGLAQDAGLAPLIRAFESGQLERRGIRPALERYLHQAWLEDATGRDERLRSFRGVDHEERIRGFRTLDAEVTRLAATAIQAGLGSRIPASGEDTAKESEPGILQRELKKQRKHMPVRKLMKAIPNLLSRLCPCFLMSPLSVSQYLEPGAKTFDLVVFDEASQIPVWDAIGPLARGKGAIIVGDSKQMPPTSFFQKADSETDEPAQEQEVVELESVLDECVAARLPTLALQWHYRSRHESLIAFSNQSYYGGKLLTFPSPEAQVEHLGVRWHEVVGGIYERGGSRTNPIEARTLVRDVLRRLRDPAEAGRSLGIVTFNMAQQGLIEDLLDKAREEDPALERFFGANANEPVFIKNLENVQGDERDVILFSVGYGPDAAGRIYPSFGPLNRRGGERRLNVAVTRARQQLVIFSTLRPDQIDLSRTSSVGARHLKRFLEFAARGGQPEVPATAPPEGRPTSGAPASGVPDSGGPGAGFDSPFEADVYDVLLGQGLAVDSQVGCSGYRIDLGIRDPRSPGRYMLGIECDGSMYHSGATARDRDRLREQVLKNLGWKIHRIWSTDWFQQRDKEIARLLAAVEGAKAAPIVTAATTPPPEPPPPADSDPPARANRPTARTPAPSGSMPKRSIDEIPVRELADGAAGILARNLALPAEALVKATSRHFGFKATGKRIAAAIEEAIDLLVSERRAVRSGDQVRVP